MDTSLKGVVIPGEVINMQAKHKKTTGNPISKSKSHPLSLRLAINAHCYQCMGGSQEDVKTKISVVQLIRRCDSEICVLRPLRPFITPQLRSKTGN